MCWKKMGGAPHFEKSHLNGQKSHLTHEIGAGFGHSLSEWPQLGWIWPHFFTEWPQLKRIWPHFLSEWPHFPNLGRQQPIKAGKITAEVTDLVNLALIESKKMVEVTQTRNNRLLSVTSKASMKCLEYGLFSRILSTTTYLIEQKEGWCVSFHVSRITPNLYLQHPLKQPLITSPGTDLIHFPLVKLN